MADTPRSLADLLALLPSSGRGEISAADLRDMLVSVMSIGGGMSCFEASTEQENVGETGVKLTCFDTDSNSNGVTPDHTDDSITIDVAGDYDVFFQASFTGTNGGDMEFRLRKNGTELNWGSSRVAGASNGSGSFLAIGVPLAVDDVITIYVQSDTATDDITVRDAQFSCRMVG